MTPPSSLETGGPRALPSAQIDPTDIVALVLMALLSIRRLELKGTDRRAFPEVARADFDGWFSAALRARDLSINACFAKFALNNAWFYGFRARVSPRTLSTGGAVIFFAWLAVLAYSVWLSSRAKRRADELGIVAGRRLVEGPPDTPKVRGENGETGGESSRSGVDA